MSNHIAFIGVGNMGNPMAQQLVKAGKKLKAYDVSAEMIQKAKEGEAKYTIPSVYFQEAIYGSEIIRFIARNLGSSSNLYSSLSSGEGVKEAKEKISDIARAYYKDYNATIDQNTLAAVLNLYSNHYYKFY